MSARTLPGMEPLARRTPEMRHPSEHNEQATLVGWCRLNQRRVPELELLFAVPNGGYRHRTTARLLADEGVRPGVCDLLLLVARQGYHGLGIEMKAHNGRTSPAQDGWIERTRAQGYRVEVCHGWREAWAVLCDYLGIEGDHEGGQINDRDNHS